MLSENDGKIPMSDPRIGKHIYMHHKMVNEKDKKKYFKTLIQPSKYKKMIQKEPITAHHRLVTNPTYIE